MNPFSDPIAHDLSISRRAFLTQSAYGLGGLALASLLEQAGAVAGGAASSRSRIFQSGAAHHSSLHGGRAVAPGDVRLEAGAEAARRPAVSRIVHEGPATRAVAEHGAQGARPVLRFHEARRDRATRSPISFRTSGRRSPTTSASSARCRPSRSITTRRTRS